MLHGPHDNCMMCKMARTIGIMRKHPKNCACETHPKNKDEEKSKNKVNANIQM